MKQHPTTNAQFIEQLFPKPLEGEWLWGTDFEGNPDTEGKWYGNGYALPKAFKNKTHNAYFSVALLKQDDEGKVARKKVHFSRLPVIAVDDIEGNPDCTWRIQTSEGSHQVGWKLEEPITDIGIVENLNKALATMKLIKADTSGNNVVRYVRLPFQVNQKYDPAFTAKLEHFDAEAVFTLEEVCDLLGIDPASLNGGIKPTESSPVAFEDLGQVKVSDEELVRLICTGESLHEPLLKLTARYAKRGMDAKAIEAVVVGMVKAHDDGTDRFAARLADVPRYIQGAIEKYAKNKEKEEAKRNLPEVVLTSHWEMLGAKLHPKVIVPNYLYADVRMRIAAGGTGKTTLALYEAMQLALGKEIWGIPLNRPMKTVLVTKEDGREVLLARLNKIVEHHGLTLEEAAMVVQNVLIYDLTQTQFRLSKVERDLVLINEGSLEEIVERLTPFNPDWVIFDPLVSFGVGESRVNDAEQGLIEAFRFIVKRLNCCVEGIHHTGKQNARDKTGDQYSGRGGSALADGSRMVAVLNPVSATDWVKKCDTPLMEGETGIVMSLPKLSYAKPQQDIYIRRSDYMFKPEALNIKTDDDLAEEDANSVYAWLTVEYREGRKYSKEQLRKTQPMGMTRQRIEKAVAKLEVTQRVKYSGGQGKSGSHYQPN